MPITKEKYTYFQPGEMLFLLMHNLDNSIDAQINREEDNPAAFDDLITAWIDYLKEVAKPLTGEATIERCKDFEIHFEGTLTRPNPTEQGADDPTSRNTSPELVRCGAFSLIPVELKLQNGEKAVEADLAKLIVDLENRRTDLQDKLNGNRKVPREKRQDIMVDTVLLNWLAGPASEYGGGGGPGSRPVPYENIPGTVPPYQFKIPGAETLLTDEKSQRGNGVIVAILDTSPTLHDMVAAYERFHKLKPANRIESHPLIESLLRPNGPFHLHPASLPELMRMRAVHLRDHNYDMSGHGLFIAGIIHTLAPQAEIHLYEVLNPEGVGDLLSIARGLQKVLKSFGGQPLVVNCSFMLNIPLLNQPITDLDRELQDFVFQGASGGSDQSYLTREGYECGKTWLARQGQVIEWICDQFLWQKSRVIAAAGNDYRASENKDRPQARFPAAFESVLGVGALPKDAQPDASNHYPPASYSNLSDAPEKYGVATLGGESGNEMGILGIYLGKFPPQKSSVSGNLLLNLLSALFGEIFPVPKNENNWAWWSGTSFASPIVAGLVTCARSDLGRSASTQQAIQELYKTTVIQQSLTINSEDGIVDVKQV